MKRCWALAACLAACTETATPTPSPPTLPGPPVVAEPAVTPVASIAVGDGFFCAALSNGGAACWGREPPCPDTLAALTGVVEVVANDGYVCARHAAGVGCCGRLFADASGVVDVPGASDATAVFATKDGPCVERAGALECWLYERRFESTSAVWPERLERVAELGEGEHGRIVTNQLCIETTAETPRCTDVGGERTYVPVVRCAIEAGIVRCTGPVPPEPGAERGVVRFGAPARSVVTPWDGLCALREDGAVECVGRRSVIGGGPDDGYGRATPIAAGATDLVASVDAVCAVVAEGVWCWGDLGDPDGPALAPVRRTFE